MTSCCVYWIHTRDQADIFSEGYVGISINSEQRFKAHKANSKSKKEKVYEAIRSVGLENVQFDVVLISDRKYCKDIEFKLRPLPDIGWNSAQGGIAKKPPTKEENLRNSYSNSVSSVRVGKNIPTFEEYRNYLDAEILSIEDFLMSSGKSESFSTEHKEKFSARKKLHFFKNGPWDNSQAGDIWKKALDIYNIWVENSNCGSRRLCQLLGLEKRIKPVTTMIKHFDMGWVPNLDERWTKYVSN